MPGRQGALPRACHSRAGRQSGAGALTPGCPAAVRQERRNDVTDYEPGQRVRHPAHPEWGTGQVQSVAGSRVTVNFEHAGKLLINTILVGLEIIED